MPASAPSDIRLFCSCSPWPRPEQPKAVAETPVAEHFDAISDGLADKVSSGKSTIGKFYFKANKRGCSARTKAISSYCGGDHLRMDVEKEKAELEGSPSMGSQPFGKDEAVSSSSSRTESIKNSPVDPISLDAPVLPAPSMPRSLSLCLFQGKVLLAIYPPDLLLQNRWSLIPSLSARTP